MSLYLQKIINYLYRRNRIIFFVCSDIVLIALAVIFAFLLRFDGEIPTQYAEKGSLLLLAFLIIFFSLPIFYFYKLYSFSWSYVSANELIALLKANSVSFLFLVAVFLVFREEQIFRGFPRSTIFISYFLVFLFCGGIRFAKRIYLSIFKGKEIYQKKERALIVGAGDAGEQIVRSVLFSKNSPYFLVGFVDDNQSKKGITIHGLSVLGQINDIPKIVQKNQIEQLIIALPSAGSGAIKKAVEMGRAANLRKIKVVPALGEILDGQVSFKDLREIQVEDLLGRKAISLDTKAIEDFIKNKKVLITGAAGSIGSELARQTAKFKPSLLLILDQDETGIFNIMADLKNKFPQSKIRDFIADIRDRDKIVHIFKEFKPDIVFHAAAYKHVPLMEEHPDEAVKNNIFGTRVVADSALENNAEKFIFISTDKAVNPTSVMGATKRAGEMICQALNQKNKTKFISVRFGNVLDSRGSVIPIFREQIKRGGPVEITHPDMKRYFMATSEAVLLVMQSAAMGKGQEVFVLDMGEPIKILDLAKEMIRLSGLEPDKDIPIVFTEPRPGEKFFEEILNAEEETMTTKNQNIFAAKVSLPNEKKINGLLKKLERAVNSRNKKEITGVLKLFAPSFKPSVK